MSIKQDYLGEVGDMHPPHFHQLERKSPGGHLLAQDSKVAHPLC